MKPDQNRQSAIVSLLRESTNLSSSKNVVSTSLIKKRMTLTKAVRPGKNSTVQPQEAFRIDCFRDPTTNLRIPMISAAVSVEHLFDLFLELLDPLGRMVHVVLESSHQDSNDNHDEIRRSRIDLPVLKSAFCDFEDLIMNDGCTGIAVLNTRRLLEVQLDEHKQLYIFGRKLKPFHRVLKRFGIRKESELKLLSESEHYHYTNQLYTNQFSQMCRLIGAGEFDSIPTDGATDSGELFF